MILTELSDRFTDITQRVINHHHKQREEAKEDDVDHKIKEIETHSLRLPLLINVTPNNRMLQQQGVLIFHLQQTVVNNQKIF